MQQRSFGRWAGATLAVVAGGLGCTGQVSSSDPTGPGGPVTILPADRATTWNPGLNSVGGIPSASWPICATLTPSGGDDASAIQSAINACGANKVVKLDAGTFKIGRTINIPSTVVLR